MTNKPQMLQDLEAAIVKMAAAAETIRISKSFIKENLSNLKDASANEEQRIAIAKHLLENYNGIWGINKITIARGVLDCSWRKMEERLRPKPPTCSRCGSALKNLEKELEVKDDSGLFRPRIIPSGWNCLNCADIPWWRTRQLKDSKTRLLRRFGAVPFSVGEYTYARGYAVMIRIVRVAGYDEPDFLETAREAALTLESYLASGDVGFITMPKLPKLSVQDSWKVTFCAGNKRLSYDVLRRIGGLPGIRIAPKITAPDEPMPFRFAEGGGIAAPLKPKDTLIPADYSLAGGEWLRTVA